MFLGTRQRLLRNVFAERHQPLYRLARPLALDAIEPKIFGPFIRRTTSGDAETVRLALNDVVTAESARFVLIWESLSAPQRRVMSALAATHTPALYSQRIRSEFQ